MTDEPKRPRGRLLRPVEAAALVGRSEKTLPRWIKNSGFPPPAVRLQGRPLWDEDEILSWLDAQGRRTGAA
jgi:predicted DNA-binding transcriptional regulator AlpA